MILMHTLLAAASTINDSCNKPICASTTNIPSSTGSISAGLSKATDTLLLILGTLSVIFVIVGGFQYTLSGGNPGRTKQARETIIYAMVGLILASSAYTILSFVLGWI